MKDPVGPRAGAGGGGGGRDAGGGRDRSPVIGVLALQGSFALHMKAFEGLGVDARRVRTPADLDGVSAIVIPGGESTVMSLLARKYGLFEPLRRLAREGLPMMGTCAGAILLGRGSGEPPRLEAAPVELVRNAYGTQVDSFTAPLDLDPLASAFQGIFIRAPKILPPASGADVEVLGAHEGDPVMVRAGKILLTTFHPELTDDPRVHEYFLASVVGGQ